MAVRMRLRPESAGPSVARGVALAAAGVVGGFLAAGGCVAQETADSAGGGITAVEGLALGHFTLEERPTGCTVVLAEDGAVAGVDVRGGAPGTREIALLDPVNSVQEAHAIVLSGGSAFGLDAASGVVRYLEERGIGYRAGDHVVPIVAAAILFDLGIGGGSVRPGPECGYEAARAASTAAPAEGSVGAGAGATVGKLRGRGRAMKGGIGTASITLEDGLTVAAVVAVNAVGDVIDPATGEVVAGVRTEDGTGFADARALLREGEVRPPDDAPDGDRFRREHDHRRRGDERAPLEGRDHEGRADGARRTRPGHLPGPHPERRRHPVRPRHRHAHGRRRPGADRRARRGHGRRGDPARRPPPASPASPPADLEGTGG